MHENQIDKLQKRIEFLEMLLLCYEDTADRLLKSHKLLLQYIEQYYSTNRGTMTWQTE